MHQRHIPLFALAAFLLFLFASHAQARDMDRLWREGMAASAEAENVDGKARDAALDRAIAAFRAMLFEDPGLVRVRLELARAFYLKEEDRLAKRHFEQVLAGDVPAGVALNVNRYLAEIRARRRWDMHAGFALAPDTNIGTSSGARIIMIDTPFGRLPFTLDQPATEESGIGLSVWAGGEYQYPLSQRWRLRAGADASRREYSGSRFDNTFLSLHGGPRWLWGPGADASLLANVRRRWAGTAPDYDDLGFSLEAGYRLTRRVTANAGASWHDRAYRNRAHLDGPILDVSLGGAWVVTPTVRADAALGWGQERPKQKRQRHERRWIRIGFSVALPRGFTVGGSGEVRWADYEGNWFPHTNGEPREDETYSARLSVHNRALAWQGFSPQISVVHEERKTNAQLYDYERTGGELRFVRVF